MLKKIAVTALVGCAIGIPALAQLSTNESELSSAAEIQKKKESLTYQEARKLASEKGWELSFTTGNGNVATLVGVDPLGKPIYYVTESNVIAAQTTGANQLWAGGSSGLNLTGSSQSIKGKMAVWDGGRVLGTHQELTGRILQKDNPGGLSDHATHVAGTMVATGVSANAKGMAYQFQELHAYDYNSDVSEMMTAAPNLLVSNHSYGTLTGWQFNNTLNRWEFYGGQGAMEDANFGYYNFQAQLFDSIAYNAPYYLIVKSAGNNRDNNGPPVGGTYYYQNSSGVWVSATRPAGMSSNDGYDIISTYGGAKNILTVGAINGIPGGYSGPASVVMSSFSSWGPTDDGRIKPDVVAAGVNLYSPVASANNAYGVFSGTSMATPNASGSLMLLQEYYHQLKGVFMRSATLKALAIHCADEAGPADGPDYQHGWGVLNVAKGAEVIKSNNLQAHQIFEEVLTNGATFTMNVVASGPLKATIVWTDPKGTVTTTGILDNPARKLVNDLDLRIIQGSTTYMPWKLDPANPAAPATTGDNNLDNVEKVEIKNAVPGISYVIQVTHKGVLERGQQAFSLILSGVNGQGYCASGASSTSGARIDSVGFGSIQHLNPNSCTNYSNFTTVSTNVEAGQTMPITVRLNSCDGTTADKIVKVFIDFNNNGSFADAGELVATSGVINGDGTFTSNITISPSVTIGNPSYMRIVMQETNDPADVTSCGTYNKGETQDYKVIFTSPANDMKVEEIVDPAASGCANPYQYVTVRLKNVGTAAQSNVPLGLIVKEGTTTITTQNAVYSGSIQPGENVLYTFQTPINSEAGVTYAYEAFIDNPSDQNHNNDTLKQNITIAAASAAPDGMGRICGTNAILFASNASTPNYFWYVDPNESPIGVGLSLTTSIMAPNNTYYIGTGARTSLGVTSKSDFPNGGDYLSNVNSFVKYSSTRPLFLEKARLYSKYSGKIELIVGDITSENGGTFTYTPISSKIIEVFATTPNVAPGTQNGYDAADTGAVYHLDLFLPAGNHAIIIKTQGNTNLFRNNNLTGNPYPFGISNFITLTGNSAATEGGDEQTHYYFLYDMQLRTTECMSEKGAVVATVATKPTVSRTGNTLTSSSATGNQWFFNGSPIAGATSQNHVATQSGNYSVRVTDNFGCQMFSDDINVTLTAVEPVTPSSVELLVSPNPSNGIFTVRYKAERKDDLRMEVVNTLGQRVHNKAYSNFVGDFSEQVNMRGSAPGIYVIRLQHGNKTLTKKIVIE